MKNKYRSDLAIAKNLGSAGSGSAHWWHQRVTGGVLTIATIWLICFSWNLSGLEVSGIIEVVKKPYNIVMLTLFTIAGFYHAALGMRVIIEDYFGISGTPRTLEDIGSDFCLTKERVRQIKEKALRRLRNESSELFDYL